MAPVGAARERGGGAPRAGLGLARTFAEGPGARIAAGIGHDILTRRSSEERRTLLALLPRLEAAIELASPVWLAPSPQGFGVGVHYGPVLLARHDWRQPVLFFVVTADGSLSIVSEITKVDEALAEVRKLEAAGKLCRSDVVAAKLWSQLSRCLAEQNSEGIVRLLVALFTQRGHDLPASLREVAATGGTPAVCALRAVVGERQSGHISVARLPTAMTVEPATPGQT